jgi:hypothetical protein
MSRNRKTRKPLMSRKFLMFQRFQILRKAQILRKTLILQICQMSPPQTNPSHPKLQPAVASRLIRTCRGWVFWGYWC